MLSTAKVDQEKYIQYASEATVCSWFAKVAYGNKMRFEYEYKMSPPKDVDCAIWHDGIQFNIEVKCPRYDKQRNIVAGSDFQIHAMGRMDDYNQTAERLADKFSGNPIPSLLAQSQHMDCKLKDYLEGAQEKFGTEPQVDIVNILFVCVDDQMDMAKWLSYLHGPGGLFTKNSFSPRENYSNVDLVVFSNLYHRHHDPIAKTRISDQWMLGAAFNFAVINPNSKKTDHQFRKFSELIPLENRAVLDFKIQDDLPADIREALRLSLYVADQIKAGIYKFQGYNSSEKSTKESE